MRSLLPLALMFAAVAAASGVASPPPSLGLDAHYVKYADASGIPVVAGAKVPDAAVLEAKRVVDGMLQGRPDLVVGLQRWAVRVAVMADDEVTTDIPEHRDLNDVFRGVDWNARARGVGATAARPAVSAAEENLLRYETDRYRGESILVHELAHTVLDLATDDVFRARVRQAYRASRDAGRWDKTYAGSNVGEYWAEGVQSWFDANRQADPANGVHNHVDTRAELARYDRALHDLVAEVFGEAKAWRWRDWPAQ